MPAFIGIKEIVLVVVLLLFICRAKRLPEIGRSLGRGMREFKEGVTGERDNEPGADRRALPKLGPLDSKYIDADVLGQARTADLALATEKTARQPGRASRARPTSPRRRRSGPEGSIKGSIPGPRSTTCNSIRK